MVSVGSSVVFLGNRPQCDRNPPTLTCDPLTLQVEPGSCVEFDNPCGSNQWQRLDAFRLCDAPSGLFVRSRRNPRTRTLCASTTAREQANVAVDYFYTTPSEWGEGQMIVTIGSASVSSVEATATPELISFGETSQLEAQVTGGTAPFTYAWTPSSTLDDPTIANPVAQPWISTNYTVTVTDANGVQATATVTVNVGLTVITSASPDTIDPGQTSNLAAFAQGGTPPHTFSWTPTDTLDDPISQTPVASPTLTTTYDVTVTDALGVQAFGSVTVNVNISAVATANPSSILPGEQSQLDVAVSGGLPPYSYDWMPADTLDDPFAPNPVAAPDVTTTYTVVVTDSAGVQTSADVTVDVQSTGGPTADLQVIWLTPNVSLQIDASGSTPANEITTYNFWCDYVAGNAPDYTGSDSISGVCFYEVAGPKTLRVEVISAGGSDAVSHQITIQ